MSVVDPIATRKYTAEDLIDWPDDGIGRELIDGELRATVLTRRNPRHGETEAAVSTVLRNWLRTQPKPRGKIVSGEASFRIKRDPDSFVGIDVAYVSARMAASLDSASQFHEGAAVLAVEILSPSDVHQRILEKVRIYLELGTVVSVVDPDLQVIQVHRPGQPPVSFNVTQELVGDPELPGFRVALAELFDD